jgi:hypothetical protein
MGRQNSFVNIPSVIGKFSINLLVVPCELQYVIDKSIHDIISYIILTKWQKYFFVSFHHSSFIIYLHIYSSSLYYEFKYRPSSSYLIYINAISFRRVGACCVHLPLHGLSPWQPHHVLCITDSATFGNPTMTMCRQHKSILLFLYV